MKPQHSLGQLPAAIERLLWSYDMRETAPSLAIISAAVMERGSVEDMRWLLKRAGKSALRSILPQCARRLSPRSLALWKCLLNINDLPKPQRIPWTAE